MNLPKRTREAQRKHPIAFVSLLAATFLPVVAVLTFLGFILERLLPNPSLSQILIGLCIQTITIPFLTCIGAWFWLICARQFVKRSVAEAFFVYPGVGFFSAICERLFVLVYGKSDEVARSREND